MRKIALNWMKKSCQCKRVFTNQSLTIHVPPYKGHFGSFPSNSRGFLYYKPPILQTHSPSPQRLCYCYCIWRSHDQFPLLTEAITDGQYSGCWLVGRNSTCRHNSWGSSCLVWITTTRWEFWLVLITVRSEHNQLGTKKLFWNIDISLFNYLLHVHVHPFWNHWWSLQSNWLSWVQFVHKLHFFWL